MLKSICIDIFCFKPCKKGGEGVVWEQKFCYRSKSFVTKFCSISNQGSLYPQILMIFLLFSKQGLTFRPPPYYLAISFQTSEKYPKIPDNFWIENYHTHPLTPFGKSKK